MSALDKPTNRVILSSMKRVLVWFRRDLRLKDNPALAAAVETGADILPVYIHGVEQSSQLSEGEASKWWLHHALEDLDAELKLFGGGLHFDQGKSVEDVLLGIVGEFDIDAVFWNRRYQPHATKLDGSIKKKLQTDGVEVHSFHGGVLNEPHAIKNKSGKPYQVFTPYWKFCREIPVDDPCEVNLSGSNFVKSCGVMLEKLQLLPEINWCAKFHETWTPSRQAGLNRLADFASGAVTEYEDNRDMLVLDGTSMLSPYLHFGQLGVREIYHRLVSMGEAVNNGYLRQLYWRDFAHHLIYHFPHSVTRPLRPEYEQFPWAHDEDKIERWRRGQTGFPIIDAAMRQLWETGWMHNRARMVVGSFLVKHLLQNWVGGADWFWNTLVDADLPNNIMGWQWVSGGGADAAPYFRVFNPLRQAERFDSNGDYVRKYVPELAGIPDGRINEPWSLTPIELECYGIKLGVTYPERMIDINEGRDGALAAYQKFKASVV